MLYRCLSCHGDPELCQQCLREMHAVHPFHHVKKWNGHFFQKITLNEEGILLFLGHSGSPCPALHWSGGHFHSDADREHAIFSGQSRGIIEYDTLTAIDVTGAYKAKFVFCECDSAPEKWMQLLDMSYFPATTKSPSTVFTFEVMDAYILQKLNSRTTPRAFMSTICRKTDNLFPQDIKVNSHPLFSRNYCY